MEEMDIDEVVDVPDTPEQLAAWAINGNRARHVIGNGLDRRMNFTALNLRNPVESELHGGSDPLGNSSTFLNARLFRRTTADDILKDEMQHSAGHQHMNKGKAPCTKFPSETLSCKKDEAVVDLIEQKKNEQMLWNGFPSGPSNGYWPNEFKGRSLNISGSPSKTAYRQSTKEANDCVLKGANSVTDSGNGINIPGKSQLDAKNNVSAYPHQIASHRLTGKKKLVKNGCISPNNIAKMSADGLGNCSKGAEHNDTRSSILVGLPCPSDIGDLVAEDDTGKLKGKEVMTRCASKEDGDNAICVLSRNSTNHEEKINKTIGGGPDAYDGREILGAWRSTHIRSKKLHGSSSGGHPSRNGKCVLNENGNRNEERRTRVGIGNKASCYSPEVEGAVSFQNRTAQPLADVLGFASRPDHSYERHQQPSAQIKRQRKQGAAPIRPPSASYNSDVVFLGSSVDMSDLQSTADHSCPSLGVPDQIIEIDESPSGSLQNVSQDIGCTDSERSDARARQLEADEMLARELQEQLYQELPVYGSGEVDANIALMLQQQEDARQASSSRSQPDLRLRNSLTSRNRPQLRSNQNNQARRGNQARVPAPNRMAQLRRRFRNQSAASISRESIFPFPVQMDLDRRMDILEALEEAANDLSNTIRARNIAGVQRDFNENDYEMLLALDENNYQHGGASVSQINSLPQSTVQRDNFEENCAICLETPTTGDTIRHLPCLHKFHKDCIDPWLSRRTSCPVCKSSIS